MATWGDCKQLDLWLDELAVLSDHVSTDDTEHQQLLTKGAFTAMSLRRMDDPDLTLLGREKSQYS
jgi:hypothetical protein